MGLSNILIKVSDVVLSNAGQKIIGGMGLSVFTYATSQAIFNQAMSMVYQYWGQLGNVMYLFGLSGADQALSMVLSAIAVRVAMNSAKLGFKKA
ncbi:DUF2523 family protein [Acinetobacter ursingii]|uniref:DUF2523 family protein n=1 Tax=Acinetobacter ursingii TaxID=108980 RepID=UPI00195CD8EE|nr:DUF2523 family protein [Acinetobacter ursingii]VTX66214.1 Uncharacterised protein [Acinetobacter ursingii]